VNAASSFVPPIGRTSDYSVGGNAVHGWHPILKYPRRIAEETEFRSRSRTATPAPIPVGKQAYFHRVSRLVDDVARPSQVFSRRRLFPPQSREPDIKRFKRPHQRLDFPHCSNASLAPIQDCRMPIPVPRPSPQEVHSPDSATTAASFVPIFVRLRKVVSVSRNSTAHRYSPLKHMRNHHVSA